MYDHQSLEKKWQDYWQKFQTYLSHENPDKEKYYILDMFPYPSGAGLHVGHPKGYIATDIIARLKMMQGYQVLHPMGFDAFGLPAENYALKNKLNPKISTEKNVINYKRQLKMLGLSYDWSREINTTDPEYYKWTQWIFLQMFKRGLAYQSDEAINWCPDCKTGLANEDLEAGHCERCGSLVEKKSLRQWVLKITDYAERLLQDLDLLTDWEEAIKEMQRNWLGKSVGTEISFSLTDDLGEIKVFTTRVDTIFGCTYLVLSPEHPLWETLALKIKNWSAIKKYIDDCAHKSDLERTDLNKEKTGLLAQGILAINPFNQKELPVFVADYVLASYGTGAVMAVPAHDERDFEFAKKYQLPIKFVIQAVTGPVNENEVFIDDGRLVDSGEFSQLSSSEARDKMTIWLNVNNLGQGKINYKLKDWVFSRQRYWGEPIPIIHCQTCGAVPVPEDQLPVVLPEVDHYEPTGTGESPLAKIEDWLNVTCPQCNQPAKRETNTMPQWAGSCWYYLRFLDPHNQESLVSPQKEVYWSPVDCYVGGAEHATRHLIYARFWHKFLHDIGVVSQPEPFIKLRQVGLIMGEDGRKMSKRWGNVINPDKIVADYGADTARVYTMFMGPFEQINIWNNRSLIGSRKFLEKFYNLFKQSAIKEDKRLLGQLHKTIKKIEIDIVNFKFNTAVSALMILTNEVTDFIKNNQAWPFGPNEQQMLIQLIAPLAPHLAEELWQQYDNQTSIFLSSWPKYQADLARDEEITLGVQINGKLRATITLPAEADEELAWSLAKQDPQLTKWLTGKQIVKKIYVPGRIFNIVIK